MSVTQLPEWHTLNEHAAEITQLHLRDLLRDEQRSQRMWLEHDRVFLDYSRQNATFNTMHLLSGLAKACKLHDRIADMAAGKHINNTENRAVLHIALRANASDSYIVDGADVVPDVLAVREKIRLFSEAIRHGTRVGITGKPMRNVIAIGVGGSYLGSEFVAEALKTDKRCEAAAKGRTLRFLANIDPVDISRALHGLDPAETLIIVISKTFTTAETLLNARTIRVWLTENLGAEAVRQHMVAVSSNIAAVKEFGMDPDNAFTLWDWVGGRYSVCSAVGLLTLALHFGYEVVDDFLRGARAIDQHFLHADTLENMPVIMGLLGVWQSSFLHRPARALLPYTRALHRFVAHIQQVDMESNGKRVDSDGNTLSFAAGEIGFGEPGTNGQHSFYQLIHQGRIIPADFIGFIESQNHLKLADNDLNNHDELMANFFAQPDALAMGRTRSELQAEGVSPELIPHREIPGNRPSNVLLFDRLDPYCVGQLLALYEHRTVVQGFIWQINSFDQWGVELGKILAKNMRGHIADGREGRFSEKELLPSTARLLARYFRKP